MPLRAFLKIISTVLSLKYVVRDGHFGNFPSAWIVRQDNLHLLSKLRSATALYPVFEGEFCGTGRPTKYGDKIDVHKMNEKYLDTSIENNLRTDIYQAPLLNKEFNFFNMPGVPLRLRLSIPSVFYRLNGGG